MNCFLLKLVNQRKPECPMKPHSLLVLFAFIAIASAEAKKATHKRLPEVHSGKEPLVNGKAQVR